MIRRRDRPDGLPFRVYERHGIHRYSIGYKGPDGRWLFRLKCRVTEKVRIADLRREALKRVANLGPQVPADGSFGALANLWLEWQKALPPSAEERRAESTLSENDRELEFLKMAFGHMQVTELQKSDGYSYLDACLKAVDKQGNARLRAEKGNKEIALARVVLEFGVRRGWLKSNPFDGIKKLRTTKVWRLVATEELELAVEVGRRMGGPQHICALALKTAWLCLRRSVEVRALTRDQIKASGIEWLAAKRQKGEAQKIARIEWSDELKATVDEALTIQRRKLAGSWYVFGNLNGQRYTKGGWKKTLSVLMAECIREAQRRGMSFRPFSLQDCRPKGVTDKLEAGHADTLDATMHSSERMVRQVYDRRRIRVAKPAK